MKQIFDQAEGLRRLAKINKAVDKTAELIGDSSPDCREAIRKDVEAVINLLPAIEGYCKVSFILGRNPLKGLREMGIPSAFGEQPAPAHTAYYVRVRKEGVEAIASFEVVG